MDPRAIAPAETLRINTKLFRNCLHGMTAEQAQTRPADRANSAIWVAVHMASARYGLLTRLGAERSNPLPIAVATAKKIDHVAAWPPLADVKSAWTAAAHALRDRIAAMTAADLDAPVEVKFPVFEQTAFGVLTFLVQHETYHLGQLALLRKQVGLPPMSYTTP